MLDAVGPLTSLLERKQAAQLTTEAAADAVQLALRFLGNAHANIATERRRRVMSHLNKVLRPLVEEAERFQTAAPYLFGKDMLRSMWTQCALCANCRRPTPGGQRQPFCRQGRPHTYSQAARVGGPSREGSRYGGRGRYRPYQGKENRPTKGDGNRLKNYIHPRLCMSCLNCPL